MATKLTKIYALIAMHNPEALKEGMVYELWNDGEVTLTKGGDLFRQRNLHCIEPGCMPSLPVDFFPIRNADGRYGSIALSSHEDVKKAKELMASLWK